MKTVLILSLTLILHIYSYAQSSNSTITNTDKNAKQILKEVKRGKSFLVDVRTPKEYELNHLRLAINISYDTINFKNAVKDLDKQKAYYLYSNTGKRSERAAKTLKSIGFVSVYDVGGFVVLTTVGFSKALGK